jgi:hypothetical protein
MLQLRLKWSNLWLRRLSAPYKPNQVIIFLTVSVVASVADPHHVDADLYLDPACPFDADPYPACHFWCGSYSCLSLWCDPDPIFHFGAYPYPDPSFQIKSQNLTKIQKCLNRLILHTFWLVICKFMRIQLITLSGSGSGPYLSIWCGSGSTTLEWLRKYFFFGTQIHGSGIWVSGSWRPVNYGSGSYLDIFWALWKSMLLNRYPSISLNITV